MKIVWYLLTVIFGAFGILALLRSLELVINGGMPTSQVLFAVIGLVLAWQCLRKARSPIPQ